MPNCSYCGGPITGSGHAGRPWPGRAAAVYCCFGCLSLGEQQQQEAASPALPATSWKLDGLGIRLGVSLIIVAQSMIFGLALNLHDDVPAPARLVAQSLILAGTLVVIALLGLPLFRAAWHELRHGRLTIEALFLLTMTGAMAASIQAFATGRGSIYFEVVSILLVVYTLGKIIGSRSRAAAIDGARAWAGQLATCRVIDTRGRMRVVPVAEILPGDVIEIHPGETFAIDGVIRDGVGFVSEAAVSGEPFAVVRRPGDRILAGAASHDATFRLEATVAGTDRQIDRLLAAIEESRDRPVSLQAQANRVGRWFFPLVVVTALGTFAYWSLYTTAGWEAALFNAMAVLLVACPCVIGLATPIVIWSAVGRLAERGLIVRAGDAIERLAETDRVMFDKTGTLTDETFALLDLVTTVEGAERAQLLALLALVQSHSRHPVARAFAQLQHAFPQEEPQVRSLRNVPGCGVEAVIAVGGQQTLLHVGRPEWIASIGTRAAPNLAAQLRATGHRIDVARDGEQVAVAVLAERLRDSAPQTLAAFRRLGMPVEVLTGDTLERAMALHLPAIQAELLPVAKQAAVRTAIAAGQKPLFVGDGINDAAALASAHAGVALASGTDLAVGAADITLYHGDLRVLPWAVELSREAVRSVRRNLYRALSYNLIGMALAASGFLHPVVAAILMTLSSLSLIFSATRIGVIPDHCDEPVTPMSEAEQPSEPARAPGGAVACSAMFHAAAFALQGVAFVLLLASARTLPVAASVVIGFAGAGVLLARVWQQWPTIPHSLDMCFGMLTLGNMGMLFGWWIDNGCVPLQDHGCCHCVDAMRNGMMGSPWMWVGMLVCANIAMRWLPRRKPAHARDHAIAMYSGGNVGMVVGMVVGGWLASHVQTDSVATAVMWGFAGMTAGMLGGMLVGTAITEWAIAAMRALRTLPRWFRAGRVRTTG